MLGCELVLGSERVLGSRKAGTLAETAGTLASYGRVVATSCREDLTEHETPRGWGSHGVSSHIQPSHERFHEEA